MIRYETKKKIKQKGTLLSVEGMEEWLKDNFSQKRGDFFALLIINEQY